MVENNELHNIFDWIVLQHPWYWNKREIIKYILYKINYKLTYNIINLVIYLKLISHIIYKIWKYFSLVRAPYCHPSMSDINLFFWAQGNKCLTVKSINWNKPTLKLVTISGVSWVVGKSVGPRNPFSFYPKKKKKTPWRQATMNK